MSAVIHTYTIVRTPPQGVEGAPYCVAIVDVDGDGVGEKETARVSGYTDGRDIRIGEELHRLDEPDEFGAHWHLT